MNPPVRILLADEYEIVLQGLMRVLERLPFAAETATARSGRNALQLAGEHTFDLCIADPALPDRHQYRLVETLGTLSPATRILLHTTEPWTTGQLAQYGIRGFVSKTSGTETLGRAIACVLKGGQYLDATHAECHPRHGGGILHLSAAEKPKFCKPS